MHVKFIARGTGSAPAAADYLLRERDVARGLREGVDVFRRDVARAVELMRQPAQQRAPERDSGPSRQAPRPDGIIELP